MNTIAEEYKCLGGIATIQVPATFADLLTFGEEKILDFTVDKNVYHNTLPKIRSRFVTALSKKLNEPFQTKGGVAIADGTKIPEGDSLESQQTFVDRVLAKSETTMADHQDLLDAASADPDCRFSMEKVERQAAKVAKQYLGLAEEAMKSPDYQRWAKKVGIDPDTATVDDIARKISSIAREKSKNKLALVGLKG